MREKIIRRVLENGHWWTHFLLLNYLIDDSGKHLINEENNRTPNQFDYDKIKYNTNKADKTIKSWLEDSYNFNKSYTSDPPIKTFMEAYFSSLPDSATGQKNYVINNFYLFYVVNNESIGKCANQIKLIRDSKDFISAIKNFKPDNKLDGTSSMQTPIAAQSTPYSTP